MQRYVNDWISIGDALTRDDLAALRRAGLRALVDVRETGEPGSAGGLAPPEVAMVAGRLGLEYAQVPLGAHNLDGATLERARAALGRCRRPVMVHCATGRRAAVVAAAYLAAERGWSADECVQWVRDLGVDLDGAPPLRDLLVRSVGHAPARDAYAI